VRPLFLFVVLLFTAHAAPAADEIAESAEHDDIQVAVSLDSKEQNGSASASVRIQASREVVYSLITSCSEALHLVPGLLVCEVVDTAADRSWQQIHHVMDYSWYMPRLSYVLRASYDPPSRVSIERVSGDLRTLRGSWVLQSDGKFTIAHYAVDLEPGFWVPQWIERAALRRDLPKMLRALRSRAEFVQLKKRE
jgi:hypothetical protein